MADLLHGRQKTVADRPGVLLILARHGRRAPEPWSPRGAAPRGPGPWVDQSLCRGVSEGKGLWRVAAEQKPPGRKHPRDGELDAIAHVDFPTHPSWRRLALEDCEPSGPVEDFVGHRLNGRADLGVGVR